MCLLLQGLKFVFSMPLLLKKQANARLIYILHPGTYTYCCSFQNTKVF